MYHNASPKTWKLNAVDKKGLTLTSNWTSLYPHIIGLKQNQGAEITIETKGMCGWSDVTASAMVGKKTGEATVRAYAIEKWLDSNGNKQCFMHKLVAQKTTLYQRPIYNPNLKQPYFTKNSYKLNAGAEILVLGEYRGKYKTFVYVYYKHKDPSKRYMFIEMDSPSLSKQAFEARPYAYSFGGDSINPDGTDVKISQRVFARMGYNSDYSYHPNVTESLVRNNLNKEIIYFRTHGWQHGIQIVAGNLHIVDHFGLLEHPGGINVEDFNLTRPNLVFYAACSTAAGTENLCRATYLSGAKCVIGWPQNVPESLGIWTKRFFERLEAGLTIRQAAEYADDYDYDDYYHSTGDNDIIRSWILYGDGSQKLKLN